MAENERVYEVTYQASKYGDGPYGPHGTMYDTRLTAASEQEAKHKVESKLEGTAMHSKVLQVREINASESLKAQIRREESGRNE